MSRNPIDLLIRSQGGPDGEIIDISGDEQVDHWVPFATDQNGHLTVNYVNNSQRSTQSDGSAWPVIPLPQDFLQVDPDLFIQPRVSELYLCTICFHIANYYWVHKTGQCRLFVCSGCYNGLRTSKVNFCPLKCGSTYNFLHQLSRFNSKSHDRSQKELLDASIRCPEGCREVMKFRNLPEHLNARCSKHEHFCNRCQTIQPNDPHECQPVIQTMEKKIQELEKALQDRDLQKAEFFSQIHQLENQVKVLSGKVSELESALELAQANNRQRSDLDHWVLSNPPRSATNEWSKEELRIAVEFKGQKFRLHGLKLDTFGQEVRDRIESLVGERIGDLLHLNHCVIDPEKRLRQHQITYRPTYLQALPANHHLAEGQLLHVKIGSPARTI